MSVCISSRRDYGGISGREAVKKFVKFGYAVVRQRGSHVRLRHMNSSEHFPITVPMKKELKIGLLRQLIQDSGMGIDDFLLL